MIKTLFSLKWCFQCSTVLHRNNNTKSQSVTIGFFVRLSGGNSISLTGKKKEGSKVADGRILPFHQAFDTAI